MNGRNNMKRKFRIIVLGVICVVLLGAVALVCSRPGQRAGQDKQEYTGDMQYEKADKQTEESKETTEVPDVSGDKGQEPGSGNVTKQPDINSDIAEEDDNYQEEKENKEDQEMEEVVLPFVPF